LDAPTRVKCLETGAWKNGTIVCNKQYDPIHLPCGSAAEFDWGAGYGHRCWTCMAVVGSIGMPRKCAEEMKKYKLLEALGSQVAWDYNKGREYEKVSANTR
jgi:hypothetical protein